jgi:hypothetical protein
MSNQNGTTGGALSRRVFLRGAGVVMTLPWLESVSGRASAAVDPKAASAPKRLVIQFMGTGINPDHWWAKGEGAAMELSQALQPLEPFKPKLNVINGLFNKPATGVGIHPGMTGNLLSGMPLTRGAVLHGGTSIDQVLASRIGQDSIQPSLVLACEQPLTGYHETNFSMAYSSHISWQSPDSPFLRRSIPPSPSTAFSRIAAADAWRASWTGSARKRAVSAAASARTTKPSWTNT